VAFDCAGVPSSLESATRAVCARGTIMNVAIVSSHRTLNHLLPVLSLQGKKS
jgi:threonine dehydrogenase-like Zn-dependent dehydrogenase